MHTRVIKELFLKELQKIFNNCLATEIAYSIAGQSNPNKANHSKEIHLKNYQNQKRNLFFVTGVDPSIIERGGRARDRDIICKPFLIFDCDFKDQGDKYDSKEELIQHTIKSIQELDDPILKQTWAIIDSGNGFHLYFRVEDKFDILLNYKPVYEKVQALLENRLKVKFDSSCKNLSRLFRLPYSTNYKDPDNPKEVTCVYFEKDALLTKEMTDGFIPTETPSPLTPNKLSRKEFKAISKKLRNDIGGITIKMILEYFGYAKFDSFKRTGKNGYRLSSPFRADRTQSFDAYDELQIFKDWGPDGEMGGYKKLIKLLIKQFGLKKSVEQVISEIKLSKAIHINEQFYEYNGEIYTAYSDDSVVQSFKLFSTLSPKILKISKAEGSLETLYTIGGTYTGGKPLPEIVITSNQFYQGNWIYLWGLPELIIPPGYSNRELLRNIAQWNSEGYQFEKIINSLGWHEINGKKHFLFPNGSISSSGHSSEQSILPECNKLKPYLISRNNWNLTNSKYKSLIYDFLSLSSKDYLYVLLSSVFLAPLNEVKPIGFSVFLVGPTGTHKSCLAGVVQGFYGSRFNHENLPESFSSTVNSVEWKSHFVKDCIFVVDDFLRSNVPPRYVDRLFRGNANNSGRGRLRSDSNIMDTKFSRSMLIATGEDYIDGNSLRARCIMLEIERGDIDIESLTKNQEHVINGDFNELLCQYISWIAKNWELVNEVCNTNFLKNRLRYYGISPKLHKRTPDTFAQLELGIDIFLLFALDKGIFCEKEVEEFSKKSSPALARICLTQSRIQQDQDPSELFINAVKYAFESENAYLYEVYPNDSITEKHLYSDFIKSKLDTNKGTPVGWYNHRTKEVYFSSETLISITKRFSKELGGELNITKPTLLKLLSNKSLLVSDEDHNLPKRVINERGDRKRVLLFSNTDALFGFDN